jgi:hypothetical protein
VGDREGGIYKVRGKGVDSREGERGEIVGGRGEYRERECLRVSKGGKRRSRGRVEREVVDL